MEQKKFGRYVIISKIGQGAMGYVFKAEDPDLNRIIALKTLRTDTRISEEKRKQYYRRFIREAKIAANLSHPGIVIVYDVGKEGETPFIAMEYLDGETLEQKIKKKEISLPMLKDFLLQLLDALQYAHEHGVIHRDIKPSNIIILKDGRVKITDFGIAHIEDSDLTKTGHLIGSPNYMSPEQVRGEKVDQRSDLFSVGVMIYYILTGVKPFAGKNLTTTIRNILEKEPPPPSHYNPEVTPEWDWMVEKLLSKDKEKRFQTAKELKEYIESMKDEPAFSSSPSSQDEEIDSSLSLDNFFQNLSHEIRDEEPMEKEEKINVWLIVGILILIILIIAIGVYL